LQAVAQVDAVGEHGQGSGLEDEFLTPFLDVLGPAERSALQPLCHTPIPSAVEVEDLDEAAPFVGEEEGRPAGGIDLDGVAGQFGESVEALAHVARCQGDVDFEVAVEGEHGVIALPEGFEQFGKQGKLPGCFSQDGGPAWKPDFQHVGGGGVPLSDFGEDEGIRRRS